KYSARSAEHRHLKTSAEAVVAVRVENHGDAAEISVADRGPGIAAENRERALRRFVRLEKSRTQPGTGPGAVLVASAARLHAGSVRLEDKDPGLQGVVTLPLGAKRGPAQP